MSGIPQTFLREAHPAGSLNETLRIGGSRFWLRVCGLSKETQLSFPLGRHLPHDTTNLLQASDIEIFAMQSEAAARELNTLRQDEELNCQNANGNIVYCHDGYVDLSHPIGQPIPLALTDPRHIDGQGALNVAVAAALTHTGGIVLHACAFQFNDKGIVAIAVSGIGKSTLAAAVIGSGGCVISDDSVLIAPSLANDHFASPFRHNMSLRHGALQLLNPQQQKQLHRIDTGKEEKWFIARDDFEEAFIDKLKVDELWLLTPPSSATLPQKQPLSAAASLVGLMASNFYLTANQPSLRNHATQATLALTNSLPCYQVNLTQRLLEAPEKTLAYLLP